MTQRARRGKLIIFEGPDGVGKSTISTAALDYLNEYGEDCELLTFPGREPGTIGNLVYRVHHEPTAYGVDNLSPVSQQTLHVAAHLDAIERCILPALEKGRHVLLDRFWWSTWVYGIIAGIERRILKSLIGLELAQWQGIRPSAAILLRRHEPIDRNHDADYWQALSRSYASLSKREKKLHPVFTLDNTGTLADTMGQVQEILQQQFPSMRRKSQRTGNGKGKQLPIRFEGSAISTSSPPLILSHLLPAKPTVVFDTYWRFAAERQRIFFKRLAGVASPWTDDSILTTYKFTNAYRAADRASQFLIKNVIYRDDLLASPEETFFRIVLFKLFNKVDTWRLLEESFGQITYADYDFKHYDRVLTRAAKSGISIYSAAYIMPSGSREFGHDRKHRNHLKLIEWMIEDELPKKLVDAPSMQHGFELLRSYPTIGDFLAYQLITDVNYSEITHFKRNGLCCTRSRCA